VDDRTEAMLRTLRTLSPETIQTTMRSTRGQTDRTFVGPTLLAYALAAGVLTDADVQRSLASGYFVVTSEDGARVAVSLAEAAPAAGDQGIILATQQDGEPLGVGVRLLVPEFPGLAGRSLTGIVGVAFRDVRGGHDETGGSAGSRMVSLSGLLDRAGDFDPRAIAPEDVIEVETPNATGHGNESIAPRRYAGIPLYRLLDLAGIRLDPAVNEDFLRRVIVATGADGYRVVIAGGEIEPRFKAGLALVATQRDGAALGDEGAARLIVPFDRNPGRWVRSLVGLTVREA
jgi:hypothetical protein